MRTARRRKARIGLRSRSWSASLAHPCDSDGELRVSHATDEERPVQDLVGLKTVLQEAVIDEAFCASVEDTVEMQEAAIVRELDERGQIAKGNPSRKLDD